MDKKRAAMLLLPSPLYSGERGRGRGGKTPSPPHPRPSPPSTGARGERQRPGTLAAPDGGMRRNHDGSTNRDRVRCTGRSADPMTHDEAFLRDIIEHAEDDTPRLVYADWLDDHGDPDRAEFIRLQCRLATLPVGDPRQPELAARERELLDAHAATWLRPMPDWVGGCEFRRGLVAAVRAKACDFLGRAEELWRVAPVD